jgi:hypothetical protein
MSTGRTSPEHHASVAAHRDQATQYRYRASQLFEKDHAYAARLVQIATAIPSAVPSTATVNLPDRVPSEGNATITTGIVRKSRTHGSGL